MHREFGLVLVDGTAAATWGPGRDPLQDSILNVGEHFPFVLLHSKLTQVVVQVFVHSRAPLVRRKCAKEGMRVFCALRFPALMKLPDANFELFLFSIEISRIGDHQLLISGAVPGKRFIVAIDRSRQRSDEPPDQDPRPYQPARSKIERCGAMRHHLGHIHFAPLPLGCRLKVVDTRDHLVNRIWLE